MSSFKIDDLIRKNEELEENRKLIEQITKEMSSPKTFGFFISLFDFIF
jgi:hypothetical protein